jgi:uncharacterized surface protein with fasciclin (FAS1) repeats
MNVRKSLALVALFAVVAAAVVPATSFAHDHEGKADAAKDKGAKPTADIVDTAIAAGSFNTLVAAVKAAGLVDALKAEGPLTVFAPTDEAFAALPAGTVENLLKPENKDQLVAILTYHVVQGKVPSEAAVKLKEAKALSGATFAVAFDGKTLTVDGAKVIKADVWASNGVIHVIDKVMLPGSGE